MSGGRVRVEDQIRYSASPDQVATMLADPTFVERKCAAMHALSHDAEVVGDATAEFTVTTRRTMPTDTLPDVARKFVGKTLELRQVDAWEAATADGSRAGTVVVEIIGAPMRLGGTVHLEPDGSGTVQTFSGDLKASVPLVGGKLERAAEPAFLAAIRKEHEVGAVWLKGR
jgi:hypothetical protein